MTTFLDTNVIIALLDDESALHDWSVDQLNKCKLQGPAIVSDIVYCEVSVAMPSIQETDEAISRLGLERISCKNDALFKAGKTFKTYKEVNKGNKQGVLPDFIIGAIAETEDAPLMTANHKDFVKYYPNLQLIRPTV